MKVKSKNVRTKIIHTQKQHLRSINLNALYICHLLTGELMNLEYEHLYIYIESDKLHN